MGKRVWLYNGQRGRAFGTAAEYIALDAGLVTPLPDDVGFAEGATLGIPCMTAHRAVFFAAPVQGRTILVTGDAGAVGHYAVQLAAWVGAPRHRHRQQRGKSGAGALGRRGHSMSQKGNHIARRCPRDTAPRRHRSLREVMSRTGLYRYVGPTMASLHCRGGCSPSGSTRDHIRGPVLAAVRRGGRYARSPPSIVLLSRFLLLAIGVFTATELPATAVAQTPLPLANWQYSVGEVLAPLGGPLPEWRVTIGAGAMIQPNFEGATRYHVEPSGILDVRYRDVAFLSDGEGVGVNLLRGRGFRAGMAVSYDVGRNSHDDPRLRNLNNVGPAPEPKVFAQYFLLPVVLTADLRKAVGGHEGLIGDAGAYVPLPVADRTYLFLGPSLSFADNRYMESYFGVSASEAASSGLHQFTAQSGLKNATLGATLVWLLGDHWLLVGEGAYERLLGDAAASPIPETRTQFELDLNIGYRF